MTAERRPPGPTTLEERPQIRDKAIVARHQLVQLATARNVLVLERLRLARLWWSTHRRHHFIVNRRELGSTTREESRNHRKTVSQGGRGRRMEHQGNDVAR